MENKYKGDFTPRYSNAIDIQNDTTLLPSEKVRELVKHYSMCLFGLASDMASADKALKDKEIIFEQTKQHNVELRAKIKELENYASPNIKPELPQLRKKITMLKQKNSDLLSALKAARDNKYIDNLTSEERKAIQADFYERRIHSLTEQIKYYREKYEELKERLKNG